MVVCDCMVLSRIYYLCCLVFFLERMDDAAPDLVEAAKTLIQNMCAGGFDTAKSLDLSFAAQVSPWLCWGVFVGLFCR